VGGGGCGSLDFGTIRIRVFGIESIYYLMFFTLLLSEYMYWVVNKALPTLDCAVTDDDSDFDGDHDCNHRSARAALDKHAALITTIRTSQTNRKQVVRGLPSPPYQLLFLPRTCRDIENYLGAFKQSAGGLYATAVIRLIRLHRLYEIVSRPRIQCGVETLDLLRET